jgi:hypothetical protein
VIALDDYTVQLLRTYLAVLDEEREAFGVGYDTSHSKLMRYADGRALHADTITRRFNRLVEPRRGQAHPAARRQAHLRPGDRLTGAPGHKQRKTAPGMISRGPFWLVGVGFEPTTSGL